VRKAGFLVAIPLLKYLPRVNQPPIN